MKIQKFKIVYPDEENPQKGVLNWISTRCYPVAFDLRLVR